MIIRPEQMRAFAAYSRRGFEERMVAHMRVRSVRAAKLSEAEVREQVREVIELAETHGIDYEDDVQRFLELVFDRWPEARSDAAVMRILNSNGLAGRLKVAFVADAMTGS